MRRGVVTFITVGSMLGCVVLGIAWAAAPRHPAPVRLLGGARIVHHSFSLAAGRVAVTRLSSVATGRVTVARVHVRRARHGARLRIGVYANHRGRPGRLLSAGWVRRPRARHWNAVSMGKVRVRARHTYWIAVLARRHAVSLAGTAQCGRSSVASAGATLPRRWRAAHRRRRGCRLSVYVSGSRPSRTSTTTTTATTTTTTPTPPVASRTTHCYGSPGACGYPDPAAGNVGVANCAALPNFTPSDLPSGAYNTGSGNVVNIVRDNVTVSGYDISGWAFNIDGVSGTVFNDDCLSWSGNGVGNVISETSNGTAVASHLTVENSTIAAPGCPVATADSALCSGSAVDAIDIAGGNATVIDNDILVGALENVNGLGTGSVIENSYIVSNGDAPGAHFEDVYAGPGTENLTISHNTLINPFDETAEVFIDNLGAPTCSSSGITVTGNLMAGGGYVVYGCSGASSPGASTFAITNNHIARCLATAYYDPSTGGHQCGTTPVAGSAGAAFGAGADSNGVWPGGGYFGIELDVFCAAPGSTWSGNVWDDNGAPVACG